MLNNSTNVDLRISALSSFLSSIVILVMLLSLSNVAIIPVLSLLNNQEMTRIVYALSHNVKCATSFPFTPSVINHGHIPSLLTPVFSSYVLVSLTFILFLYCPLSTRLYSFPGSYKYFLLTLSSTVTHMHTPALLYHNASQSQELT